LNLLQMAIHRLIIGLCATTFLILLYYFTIIDVHIIPVIYIDRSAGESIAVLAPFKFERNDVLLKSREERKIKEEDEEEEEEEEEGKEGTTPPEIVPYDSIFVYRAYYDDRSSNGTVRVLLMSKCIKDQDFFQMRVGSELQPMLQRPVEGSRCPWAWAPRCKWNAYSLESLPISSRPRSVTIIVNKTREIEVEVNVIPGARKNKFQVKNKVCVPPLFWYTDWPRVILFFEMWKKHNPTFMIYVNSISSKVMKVLEHYQKQDLVQIVNWPLLPLAENGEDPNLSIYRLSHSLAHNDCVMRMKSEFGALVDIDEYLHLLNGETLMDFAREELEKKSNLGSWSFNHHGLFITPLDETFGGIHNASVVRMNGPGKTFFRPETVKFLSTHTVNKHVAKYKHRSVRYCAIFL
ncbi:hypothetical protein PENTCL1PPCAC_2651, partial [Pristionchus entomophagus]